MRKREKGQLAVARGLVAVGVGDQRQAERHARDSERLLGSEPLALLLKAQTAQLAGNEKGAELAFKAMLDNPDTHGLGCAAFLSKPHAVVMARQAACWPSRPIAPPRRRLGQ